MFKEGKSGIAWDFYKKPINKKKSALIFGSKSKLLLMKNEKESLKTNYKKKIFKIKNINWEQKVKLLERTKFKQSSLQRYLNTERHLCKIWNIWNIQYLWYFFATRLQQIKHSHLLGFSGIYCFHHRTKQSWRVKVITILIGVIS